MATTLYTTAACPFSRALREQLVAAGKRFTEVDVGEHPERVPELLKVTRGRRIVPVLIDGVRIEVAPDGGSEI